MDRSAAPIINTTSEESIATDRKRLDSFRLGASLPSSNSNHMAPKLPHVRSRSRHTSVSTISFGSPLTSISSTASIDSPPSPQPSLGGSKRNSHHRRRSSVSTRRESADLMGMALPIIPASVSQDNVNFGDKDSIRRRALLTLEGKTDVGSFSSVEIPELTTPVIEKKAFEFPSKPSYPPGMGAGYGSGLNSLNKRESFGKFMSTASTKEQLHTLIEEEEEEEEADDSYTAVNSSPPAVASPSPALTRRRPASLNLRPLTLAHNQALPVSNGDLPTPSPTPSARPGLKSLTLPSLQSAGLIQSSNDNALRTSNTNKRQSFIMTSSSFPPVPAHKPTVNEAGVSTVPTSTPLKRRSSIAYVSSSESSSFMGLPTPEMTPVTERSESRASTDSDRSRGLGRPLSTSEQHFLFQAHATLVHRITELERVLSSRPRSRPLSYASDVSTTSSNEPSNEMLQMVADLKAERDELKKDVDGWRTRVVDMERTIGLFAKRIENERRDAWVARERVGLLDVEKSVLEKALAEKIAHAREGWEKYESVKADAELMKAECQKLNVQVSKITEVEAECERLKSALAEEQRRREYLEHELEGAGLLATPTPRAFELQMKMPPAIVSRYNKSRGLGFRSIDSTGSFTDVESLDGHGGQHKFSLKAVEEETESDSRDETLSNCSDREDELARYQDEGDEDDYAFHGSYSDSSMGSMGDFDPSQIGITPESTPRLYMSRSASSSPAPPLTPLPTRPHDRRNSLSEKWTFPRGAVVSVTEQVPDEIDRFFGCLDDVDNSPPMDSQLRSMESGKTLFSQALADDEDELPPFVLPVDVGVEVVTKTECEKFVLDVVAEVDEEEEEEEVKKILDEEEFVGEVDEGGIKFVFTPPPGFEQSEPSEHDTLPPVGTKTPNFATEPFDDDEDSASFTFPQARPQLSINTPSSIPRPASSKAYTSSIPTMSTPVKASSVNFPRSSPSPSSFVTPPPKRGGASPAFIPQSRGINGSPFKTPTPIKDRPISFIPQPRRNGAPSPTANNKTSRPPFKPLTPNASFSSYRCPDPVITQPPCAAANMSASEVSSPLQSSSTPSSQSSRTLLNDLSPTLASRLSFQTLTNLIPIPSISLSWSPRASAAAAMCIIPEGSSAASFVNSSTPQDRRVVERKETVYVPKERQLERLRIRLDEERRRKVGMGAADDTWDFQDDVLHI